MNKIGMWLIAAVIIVMCVYAIYRYTNKTSMYQAVNQPATEVTPMQGSSSSDASTASGNKIIEMKPNQKLGTYITDSKGVTLYVFTNDKPGISNCTGGCLTKWPPFLQTDQNEKLETNLGVIKRVDDGKMQYTWKGMPLYYYVGDKNPGDTTGDGAGGIWFVAK
ncbi:hypothetical protein M1271_06600 [Patescibacteria group bacterium]|nr:hypothetical protein [Patescibacteria group bacterium]MCL5798401.1 hypothetical protein [Patescibacteria group bacterium]